MTRRRRAGTYRAAEQRTSRGSATIYAVAAMATLSAMALTALFLVAAAAAQHRASGAADLAALAGAAALSAGADPCRAAATIAERNGAELAECLPAGSSVTVSVTAAAPRFLGLVVHVPGRARAGQGGG